MSESGSHKHRDVTRTPWSFISPSTTWQTNLYRGIKHSSFTRFLMVSQISSQLALTVELVYLPVIGCVAECMKVTIRRCWHNWYHALLHGISIETAGKKIKILWEMNALGNSFEVLREDLLGNFLHSRGTKSLMLLGRKLISWLKELHLFLHSCLSLSHFFFSKLSIDCNMSKEQWIEETKVRRIPQQVFERVVPTHRQPSHKRKKKRKRRKKAHKHRKTFVQTVLPVRTLRKSRRLTPSALSTSRRLLCCALSLAL